MTNVICRQASKILHCPGFEGSNSRPTMMMGKIKFVPFCLDFLDVNHHMISCRWDHPSILKLHDISGGWCGIIKKTRTVTECLHRYCRECIDKWMRMGNKECPACRTHCASQHSLRDDPRFDALIHFLYDDIEKYEEEERAFHEEEKTRDKQASTSMKHGHLSGGHIPVSDTLERLGHVGTKAV
ncbi:hypothetical protein CsSME_00019722 [Camellia sinensis var. sinensis]